MRYLLLFTLIVLVFAGCRKEEAERKLTPLEVNYNVTPNHFLSAATYQKLVVEVQYVTGFQPNATALARLQTFLETYLNKPSGISIVQTEIASPGKAKYSLNDIVEIEKASRTQNTSAQLLTAYILFVDGEYSGNEGSSKVLGVAYYPSSMVIFGKSINEFSGGFGQPARLTLQTTVLNHEFGHVMGLVNNGTPIITPHQDVPNGRHCTNENCLMYYETETNRVIGRMGTTIPALDSACVADLRANGGK